MEIVNALDDMPRATRETVERAAAAAYVECALWASTDEEGEPLDARFSAADIAPESRAAMVSSVRSFLEGVWEDERNLDLSAVEPEQIGHDFWLTRNRHGAGFWDRGLGELGDILTVIAHGYGETDLYVGDDGQLHYCG